MSRIFNSGSIVKASSFKVGSIYISIYDTDPSTLFGGTWEKLQDRFLVGAGNTYSNGATGGEATHTLSVAEMPNHTHTQYVGANSGDWGVRTSYTGDSNCAPYNQGSTGDSGGGQSHNNLPPYLAVYMWKRTA